MQLGPCTKPLSISHLHQGNEHQSFGWSLCLTRHVNRSWQEKERFHVLVPGHPTTRTGNCFLWSKRMSKECMPMCGFWEHCGHWTQQVLLNYPENWSLHQKLQSKRCLSWKCLLLLDRRFGPVDTSAILKLPAAGSPDFQSRTLLNLTLGSILARVYVGILSNVI